MEKETILVVDDSLELLHLLELLLGQTYQVETALDGERGLQSAQLHQPDLIILDMNMPRMGGMEMLSALRETDCQAPVIFMTAASSEYVAVQAFRMGVADYLTKPFSPKVLQAAIDQALDNKRLAKEKERLSQALIAAQATRQTVATLAHYINNHLMVAQGNLSLLDEELCQVNADGHTTKWLEVIRESQKSTRTITAVLRVAQKLMTIDLTNYYGDNSLIDIEAALQEELQKM